MRELPDDWHPPLRDLVAEQWEKHPERERLEGLWRERDENEQLKWKPELRYEADGWTELWLVPLDPRDPRPAERVGSWHTEQQELGPVKDAQAFVDEHHLDD